MSSSNIKKDSAIITDINLQEHFYERLNSLNEKSLNPIIDELIHYVSFVLDKFSRSDKFFDVNDDKFQDKILGKKLLEVQNLSLERQKDELKDIGDMSLCLCGRFSESLDKKIINMDYYQEVGEMAYERLNSLVSKLYEIKNFYKHLSNSLDGLITYISCLTSREEEDHILNLVNRWHETGEIEIREKLLKLGVWVDGVSKISKAS